MKDFDEVERALDGPDGWADAAKAVDEVMSGFLGGDESRQATSEDLVEMMAAVSRKVCLAYLRRYHEWTESR